jgi:hypothetical protein
MLRPRGKLGVIMRRIKRCWVFIASINTAVKEQNLLLIIQYLHYKREDLRINGGELDDDVLVLLKLQGSLPAHQVIEIIMVLLHNVDAHNVNVTGHVC